MRVKVRSSTLSPIHAAVLREPGHPLRIEKLEMEGPRQDEVLARLVAIAQRSRQVNVAELLPLVRQQ